MIQWFQTSTRQGSQTLDFKVSEERKISIIIFPSSRIKMKKEPNATEKQQKFSRPVWMQKPRRQQTEYRIFGLLFF